MTIEEVGKLIGAKGLKGTSSNGGSKSASDAALAMSSCGAEAMAKLLVFARASWLSEEIMVFELPASSKEMQTRALLGRFGRESTFSIDDLPVHATNLCACCECKRVANAHSNDMCTSANSNSAFNEIGVSCSMLSIENGASKLRCAKRSSAALRTAVTFEEEMSSRKIEQEAIDSNGIRNIFLNHHSADAGIAARIRRDAKNSFEQRSSAMPCGENPLLVLPILGKVVRIWDEYYSLCCFCGCMLRVYPNNRFGGHICCLKCDSKMLGIDAAANACTTTRPSIVCRYCGKSAPP